jgi:hypothetical protein
VRRSAAVLAAVIATLAAQPAAEAAPAAGQNVTVEVDGLGAVANPIRAE